MTHAEMERELELARTTGEPPRFHVVETPVLRPQLVDWDELDAQRVAVVPQRSRQKRRVAA